MGGTSEDDEARRRDIERIKAEARAYALSDMTRKKERERAKFSNLPASMMGGTGRARRRPAPPPQYHPGSSFQKPPYSHHTNQHEEYPPHQQHPYPAPYGYPYQHHYQYPPYQPHYPPVHAHQQQQQQHQQQHPFNETADTIPPISPPDEKDSRTRRTSQTDVAAGENPVPSRPTFAPHSWNFDEYDEDYGRFVKSLWDDDLFANDEEEDADEFHLEKEDEDDDENDDDKDVENVDTNETTSRDSPKAEFSEQQQKKGPSSDISPLDPDLLSVGDKYYQDLEEELGWLEEEDMEAAVTTLLDPPKTPLASNTSNGGNGNGDSWSSPAPSVSTQKKSPRSQSTPFREAARATHVTETQYKRLQQLFRSHYQLLLQQTVLAARAAPTQSKTMESASDLMQIVNHATGMLQDIDQHRRNAILSKVQQGAPQRLTRLQFSKTLQEHQSLETVFDVQGLKQLKETFDWIDKSVEVLKAKTQDPSPAILKQEENDKVNNENTADEKSEDATNRLLPTDTDSEACRKVFKHVGAGFNADILPGARDLSEIFADSEEVLGVDFIAPCTPEQNAILRKNRNLFTFGEDNLVLQGVNLYGEKQWILLADRLLPDRSVNIISQRYAKLCVMLYKANGVKIDDDGNLETPPKYDSVDDVDEKEARKLRRVQAPAILNVHRWSLQEDLTTLKAVPIYGTMWAEISSKYLPHRDRGHIRKRYLVLQRRIKSAVSRERKHELPQRSRSSANRLESALPESRNTTHATVVGKQARELVPRKIQTQTNLSTSYGRSRPMYAAPRMDVRTITHRPRTPSRDVSTKKPSFIVTKSPPLHVIGKPVASYEVGPIHEDNSRAAFEKLVQDNGSRLAFERLVEGPDSSQGNFMKQSVESDTESVVATTIVTKLANAYPSEYLENDDSNSQFSMLDSYRLNMSLSRDVPRESKSTKESAARESCDENNIPAEMPPPSKITAQESTFSSPKKAKKLKIQETPTRTGGRLTTSTPTAQSFCEFGAMLSPALKHLGSPSLTLHTFPETSNLIKDGEFTFDSNGGQSHILSVPQTPSSAKSSTSSGSVANHANFWSQNSTLMENDLEAISALNSLSSSPAGSKDTASPSKSLFAKVVGRARNTVQPSTKKRKLQF